MSEPTTQELKDLILGLEKLFISLDKKMDIQFIELKSDIRSVEDRLSGEIKRLEEKIGGIDKRLGNEEFISRGAITAVFVSVAAGVIKYLFSSPTRIM